MMNREQGTINDSVRKYYSLKPFEDIDLFDQNILHFIFEI